MRCCNSASDELETGCPADVATTGDVEVVDVPSSGPMYKPRGQVSDEIDYEIFGTEMQYVEIVLDPGETVIAEAGMMMYMDNVIQMETMFGSPGNHGSGFWQKVKSQVNE